MKKLTLRRRRHSEAWLDQISDFNFQLLYLLCLPQNTESLFLCRDIASSGQNVAELPRAGTGVGSNLSAEEDRELFQRALWN